jgi:glycosyltransferase involved in cell wall biosynthesis
MKLNVNIVHHYSITLGRGGEKIIKSIATELSKRGHSISVFSIPFRRRKINQFYPFYYRECFLKKLDCDVAYYVYVPLIHKLFRTSAPKIAGLHSFVVLLKFSHEHIRYSYILYKHGILAFAATYFSSLTKGRDLNNFNGVHIPNIINKNNLKYLEIYGKEKPLIYTIPNWVDLQVFKPRNAKSDVFTVLFVGSEKWSKGYDIFYYIARYLHKIIPKIRFIAVGVCKDGSSRSTSFIEEYPFIYQEDILANIYSSSHILVYPSRADIFGITLIESLACGTPVLTSALPSHTAFLPSKFICFTTYDYIRRIIEIYQMWCKKSGEYELLVNESRSIASMFDKNKLFPLFERMLIEVANKGV